MKLVICALLILVVCVTHATPSLYSGKLATFAKYKNKIAMHEHGVVYNAVTDRFERKSSIEVIDIENKNKNFNIQSSPILLALSWTADGKYLVGISNINEFSSPHIVIYSDTGEEQIKVRLDCNAIDIRDSFFCYRNAGYHRINRDLNGFRVSINMPKIEVCVVNYCKELILKSIGKGS